MMSTFVKVASASEIAPGTAKRVDAGGKEIAIFNVGGVFYATSNICPHQGGPLDEGMIEGSTVVCPWHAWTFDVSTGASPVNPRVRVETYPVRIEGEDIYVGV